MNLRSKNLKELEKLSEKGEIDIFYGDESPVCSEGYVPYGWQFPDEQVCILSEKAHRINCFGMINRQSKCFWSTIEQSINAQFILECFENFSFEIHKETFVILDNASVHRARIIRERMPYWQKKRTVYIFFATIFTTFEYRRNNMAQIEERMVSPRGLLF